MRSIPWSGRTNAAAVATALFVIFNASCSAPSRTDEEAASTRALTTPAPGATLVIGFEVDANDAPLAPGTLLDEQFAPVGVHFNGRFFLGDRTTDFASFDLPPTTGNMICTFAAAADTGVCTLPDGGADARMEIDLDFDACRVEIEGRTRSDGEKDIDLIQMSAFDAASTLIERRDYGVSNEPAPFLIEGLVDAFVVGTPTRGIRRVTIFENLIDAWDRLRITRCADPTPPPVAVCADRTVCTLPNQCVGIANIDAGSTGAPPLAIMSVPPPPYPLGITPVTLTVTSGNQSAMCRANVTVNDCQPPNLVCPAPQTLECTGNGSASAVVTPVASDNCGPVTASCSPGSGSFPLGTTPVACSATDGAGNPARCNTTVTVVDTTPPVIVCPPPVTIECTGNGCGNHTPAPATATDLCGPASVQNPGPACFPLGTTTLVYTATDAAGNRASCTSTVTVVNTRPPVVIGDPSGGELWPPNHKYHTITLADCGIKVVDQCTGQVVTGPAGAQITCVTSDEPDNDGGDGNTSNDIVIVDATTVRLRAERQGGSDGRVYNIGFRIPGAGGGSPTTGTCKVVVPHDQSGRPAIDSGPAQTVCR